MLRRLQEDIIPLERWQPACFIEDTMLSTDWKLELHLRIQLIQDAIQTGVLDNIQKWCDYLEDEMQWFPNETSAEVREYIIAVLQSAKNVQK